MHQPVMTIEDIRSLLRAEFPQVDFETELVIEAVEAGQARVRFHARQEHLRPGGTVSGPNLMLLADTAAYVVVLAHLGPVALAVTTNLNINFLRKPLPGDVYCDCRLLKFGKRLAVTEARLHTGNADEPVAHATATYSIPPNPDD